MGIAGLFWGGGYFGLWAIKWLLAIVMLGATAYEDIREQVMFRLGVGERASQYPSTPVSAIQANLDESGMFRVKIILWIAIAFVVLFLVFVCKNRLPKCYFKDVLQCVAGLSVIAVLPFVWYAILHNHSVIHAEIISWRNLMLTMFAGLLLLYILIHCMWFKSKSN